MLYKGSVGFWTETKVFIVCPKDDDHPKLYVKIDDSSKIIAVFSVVYHNFFIKINSPNNTKRKVSPALHIIV